MPTLRFRISGGLTSNLSQYFRTRAFWDGIIRQGQSAINRRLGCTGRPSHPQSRAFCAGPCTGNPLRPPRQHRRQPCRRRLLHPRCSGHVFAWSPPPRYGAPCYSFHARCSVRTRLRTAVRRRVRRQPGQRARLEIPSRSAHWHRSRRTQTLPPCMKHRSPFRVFACVLALSALSLHAAEPAPQPLKLCAARASSVYGDFP